MQSEILTRRIHYILFSPYFLNVDPLVYFGKLDLLGENLLTG